MASLALMIPDEYYNKLNNHYIENFGYDIHTQFFNYILQELEKCESTSEEREFPKPYITKDGDKFEMGIQYSDGTVSTMRTTTYEEAIERMNEWSKYSFNKDDKDKVYQKFQKPENKFTIHHYNFRNTWLVVCLEDNTGYGQYKTREDAQIVLDFLSNIDNYSDYTSENMYKNIEGCHQQNVSKIRLKIAKGELEV